MTQISNFKFRSELGENVFNFKYKHERCQSWPELAKTLAEDVCGGILPSLEVQEIAKMIEQMKFLPGGRYIYYAGRALKYYNNCFLLRAEADTREEWADLAQRATSCLMTGGGIGIDYSRIREKGAKLSRTGGEASGPISLMHIINEIGRYVKQGGSRRSAIYGSLRWNHPDALDFLIAKNWYDMVIEGTGGMSIGKLKEKDFNYHAPLDCTNISLNYDTDWIESYKKTGEVGETFLANVRQALMTGEPGFSFNFYDKVNETLRNAPVSGDTQVLTGSGYQKIYDIVDEPVTVWTGKNWAENVVFVKTKSDVKTVKIGFTGDREIKADPEHEFFVERWSGKGKQRRLESIDKVPASELKLGDTLHVSLPNHNFKEMYQLDKNFYTMGFAYGDGSFSKNGVDVSICCDEKKPCLENMRDDYKVYNDKRGYFRIKYKDYFFGVTSKYTLPNLVTIEEKASFLSGLFDADGCFNMNRETPTVRLSSISKEFLHEVRRLLETMGILSSVSCKGYKSGFGGSECYNLIISSSSLEEFNRLVAFRKRVVFEISDWKPYRETKLKVTSISVGEVEDVFCCDVKLEEHSFCAEGVIISNCCEVVSEDDSDVCNLGSINLANVLSIDEFVKVIELATKFLICGTLKADLPYQKVSDIREKNRRLGLGLMGMHEWLLVRGYRYEVTDELHQWLAEYKKVSTDTAYSFCDKKGISRPVGIRSIAPTGSIAILAGTTSGIEPIYEVSYTRRYLEGQDWMKQFMVDTTAKYLIQELGVDPDDIETATDLAKEPERRIKFQADVQDYVDQAISSTINLPKWGSEDNPDSEEHIQSFANTLAKYSHRLRGFTCYPDGARGGQPIEKIPYKVAIAKEDEVIKETFHDMCSIFNRSSCGDSTSTEEE